MTRLSALGSTVADSGRPCHAPGMRLIYACLSLATLGIAARAAATSCALVEHPWESGSGGPLDEGWGGPDEPEILVPVDAQLWQRVPCGPKEPAVTGTCELVDEAETTRVVVATEHVGAQFCEDANGERYASRYYIRRFIPPAPLTPGEGYSIQCEDPRTFPGSFRVRDSEVAAALAPAIELASAFVSRGDDGGCCSEGDRLELRFADMDPEYLREGGYIEAVYPGGQHLVFMRPEGDRFVLPGLYEVIELTPVSASGVRGQTLVLDAGEADGDLVYVPCDVSGRRPVHGLWLLAPLVWVYARARRRRSV